MNRLKWLTTGSAKISWNVKTIKATANSNATFEKSAKCTKSVEIYHFNPNAINGEQLVPSEDNGIQNGHLEKTKLLGKFLKETKR